MVCQSGYAFGSEGYQDKIPGGATIVSRIQLLNWRSLKSSASTNITGTPVRSQLMCTWECSNGSSTLEIYNLRIITIQLFSHHLVCLLTLLLDALKWNVNRYGGAEPQVAGGAGRGHLPHQRMGQRQATARHGTTQASINTSSTAAATGEDMMYRLRSF